MMMFGWKKKLDKAAWAEAVYQKKIAHPENESDEKLPCAPCVAVPHKQFEHIVTYDVVILVCPQNFIGATGQIVGGFPLFCKLPRQTVKQGQP